MNALELTLVYAGVPLAILIGIALFTVVPKLARAPRYRPGREWDHEPIWWTSGSNVELEQETGSGEQVSLETLGGARGTW